MVIDYDSQRIIQKSRVSVEDENNVKHYGQLEEITNTVESDAETDPPTITVNEVSDAKTDYDENDQDYDTDESKRDIELYEGEFD